MGHAKQNSVGKQNTENASIVSGPSDKRYNDDKQPLDESGENVVLNVHSHEAANVVVANINTI